MLFSTLPRAFNFHLRSFPNRPEWPTQENSGLVRSHRSQDPCNDAEPHGPKLRQEKKPNVSRLRKAGAHLSMDESPLPAQQRDPGAATDAAGSASALNTASSSGKLPAPFRPTAQGLSFQQAVVHTPRLPHPAAPGSFSTPGRAGGTSRGCDGDAVTSPGREGQSDQGTGDSEAAPALRSAPRVRRRD